MKYIIMADGKGTRWNNYNDITKHFCVINGEPIILRTVRLLRENGIDDIIITSHNPSYNIEGAKRYEPLKNNEEIDRFTYELINEEIVFLYGDTYYEEKTIQDIINAKTDKILFFGNDKSIVAIKVIDYILFKSIIDKIKEMGIPGKGWTVYQIINGLPFDSREVKDNFIYVGNNSIDVNTPGEYTYLVKKYEGGQVNEKIHK